MNHNHQKLINLAVIAHVDAGKSTLVDAFLDQSNIFSDHQSHVSQVMDSNDLERERGITIYSKNCSVHYKDVKINIVDTPGHADFSSEVERILKTVDTVILLVDSAEGPMPQTRFVLRKSLEIGLKPILLINKVDKKDARVSEVIDEVVELFLDLGASDDQLDFPILYGIAKEGKVSTDLNNMGDTIQPLFETIVNHVPFYPDLDDKDLQLQISSLMYDDYIGRIGVGRITQGTISKNQEVAIVDSDNKVHQGLIANLFVTQGLARQAVDRAQSGDIVLVSGLENISIGDTLNNPGHLMPLAPIHIDEPTLSMNFMVNTSPFAGRSGKYVTSRNLKERLLKELEVNVGLRVEMTSSTDSFKVSGRGELHLTILIEKMRREGYELAISKPQVIFKQDDQGKLLEPFEEVQVEVSEAYSGSVISKLGLRKGLFISMQQKADIVSLLFHVPTRGLLGYQSEFITDTRGEGTLLSRFLDYRPYSGDLPGRQNGSMISTETGVAMTYSIFNLQERGQFFIGPQTDVYEGMIVGVSSRPDDLEINPTKNKKQTAIRSSGNDEAMKLVPAKILTLEKAIEFIKEDELVEVTPAAIRLRKKILSSVGRKQAKRGKGIDHD